MKVVNLNEYCWHNVMKYLSPLDLVRTVLVWPEAKAESVRAWRKLLTPTMEMSIGDSGKIYSLIEQDLLKPIEVSSDEFQQILISVSPFVKFLKLCFENHDSTAYYVRFESFRLELAFKVIMSANEFDKVLELFMSDTSLLTFIQLSGNIRLQAETFDMIFKQNDNPHVSVDASCFNHISEHNFDTSEITRLSCKFISDGPGFCFPTFQNHFPNLQWLKIELPYLRTKEEFQNAMSRILPPTKNLKFFSLYAELVRRFLEEPDVRLNSASDGLASILRLSKLENLKIHLVNYDTKLDDDFCEQLVSRLPRLKVIESGGIVLSDRAVSLLVTPEIEVLIIKTGRRYDSTNHIVRRPGEFIFKSLEQISTLHRVQIAISNRTLYDDLDRICNRILIRLSEKKRVVIKKGYRDSVMIVKRKDDEIIGGFTEEETLVLELMDNDCIFNARKFLEKVKKHLKTHKDHHVFIIELS